MRWVDNKITRNTLLKFQLLAYVSFVMFMTKYLSKYSALVLVELTGFIDFSIKLSKHSQFWLRIEGSNLIGSNNMPCIFSRIRLFGLKATIQFYSNV